MTTRCHSKVKLEIYVLGILILMKLELKVMFYIVNIKKIEFENFVKFLRVGGNWPHHDGTICLNTIEVTVKAKL